MKKIEKPNTFDIGKENGKIDFNFNNVDRLLPDYYSRVEMDAKLDAWIARIDSRFNSVESRLDRVEKDIALVRTEVKEEFKSLKYWIAGAIVTLIFSFGGLYYAGISGALAGFDTGASVYERIAKEKEASSSKEKDIERPINRQPASVQPIIIQLPAYKK